MRMYALLTIVFVTTAFVLHMSYIMYDYGFYNPDSGALYEFTDALNETMNTKTQSAAWNNTQMLKEAFGLCRFGTLAVGLTIYVIGVIDEHRKKESG